MKVLVTGATGFIGNYVVNELLKLNDLEIIATSMENKNVLKNEWLDEVKYIQANLNNYDENYFILYEKPELLIHLAWEGLPNYKEFLMITSSVSISEGLRKVKLLANTVVIKNGDKGSFFYCGKKEMSKPSFFNPEVVDCIGAGDSFNSGFLSSFIKKKNISLAIQLGVANATACIQKLGAKEGLLGRSQSYKKVKVRRQRA